MKEQDTSRRDPPDPADVMMAVWGERPAPKPAAQAPLPPSDIWGSAPAAPIRKDPADSVDPLPDLWGDGNRTDRGRRQGAGREERPARSLMPEAWAASPRPKLSWRQRHHHRP